MFIVGLFHGGLVMVEASAHGERSRYDCDTNQ
jgi:hypothetical protein